MFRRVLPVLLGVVLVGCASETVVEGPDPVETHAATEPAVTMPMEELGAIKNAVDSDKAAENALGTVIDTDTGYVRWTNERSLQR